MKKVLSLLLLSSLALTSCDETTVYPVRPSTLISGTWKMVKQETYEKGTLIEAEDLKNPDCDYDYYVLNSDGTKDEVYHDASAHCSQDGYPGTWSFDEEANILTLIDDEDGYQFVAEPVEFTKAHLKLKLINDGGTPVPADFEVFIYLKK